VNEISTLERPDAAPPPIDPRIRARRIEVRRDEGRRRLSRVVEAALVLAVAALFAGALWTPLLDVDAIQVTGTEHLSAQEVVARTGIEPGDPLIGVDVGVVGARIVALPWVAQATVSRRVGGVVAVDITERTPVARVVGAGGAVLVDAEGRVLGPAGEGPADQLVVLEDLATVPPPGSYLDDAATVPLAIAERLAVDAPGVVATLRADDLVATLAQGGEVSFGDADFVDAKLRSLLTVLDQVDLTCLGVIDLRLPGSPVLTREDGCS
jgi:cell division protein FtsQ